MMNNKEIRWKQRFQNFEKAFLLLQKYVKIVKPNEIERAGIIQFFEMAFELSWKLMKDYLESTGFLLQSPRESIKQAFQTNLIEDGHIWIDALNDRNLTAHTYDEKLALQIIEVIRKKYYPEMNKFYLLMDSKK
ncbi:MAG: nucleotidyltransferase substrate binding protein [Candidatus Cloacimonetes bacterium]|nr:nucleotidyltransferase substrate binding protein [Candidatus Cloacimonadota bacterium]MCF7813874.1 nucleotidyltransferase substrate binding protein [Candidatus Cloacimonadota bacterium]MCF7868915.1 nucleotidyltransferase substrate binding protein [Candidatus Cloacimonadota bacterium]MCF7883986.1 nucleotidyltransferase substrate binding protein [Candidatus Cloacimonadota bacterium]